MFNGSVYFDIFIDNEFEFGCYSVFYRERIKAYNDIKLLFLEGKILSIDDDGDLNIALYFISKE